MRPVIFFPIAILLCLILLGCAPTTTQRTTGAGDADVVGPRKIIALVSGSQARRDMREAAEIRGYQTLDLSELRALSLTMLTFRMPEGKTRPEAIAELEAAVPGSTVGSNHAYRLQQERGAARALNYANEMMRWPAKGCQARAPIGMIDTAIDRSAPALAQARIVAQSFAEGQPVGTIHGTDVASLLAGPGRLRGVTLYGANVFSEEDARGPKAGADALVRALDWLAGNEARFVNLSLAGPYNKLLDLAISRSVSRGLILVAAVGNEGPNVAPLYPAGFKDVIAVTAVDANERIYRNAVRGAHVDVSAPGVDVLVGSGGNTRFVTGTSMAAPFVTARIAADPSLANSRSVSQVRQRLSATSKELGPTGRDPMFGYGLVLANGLCEE